MLFLCNGQNRPISKPSTDKLLSLTFYNSSIFDLLLLIKKIKPLSCSKRIGRIGLRTRSFGKSRVSDNEPFNFYEFLNNNVLISNFETKLNGSLFTESIRNIDRSSLY